MHLLKFLRDTINDDLLYFVLISVAVIFIAGFIGKTLAYLVKKLFAPLAKKTATNLDDKIIVVAEKGLYHIILLVGFGYSINIFEHNLSTTTNSAGQALLTTYPFAQMAIHFLSGVFFVLIVFVFFLKINKLLSLLLSFYAEKTDTDADKLLSRSFVPLLRKVISILLFVISLGIVFSRFHIDISSLVVSLGVGSLAIAFAAQETLSNMISGFILMVDRPFRIGDRIRIGAGSSPIIGTVLDIGIRSTRIRDFDQNILIIPNNELAKSTIINISFPNDYTRVLVEVGVAYGSDISKVKEIMLKVASDHPHVSKDFPPEFGFMGFGDSALNVRLAAIVQDYRESFSVNTQLREAIYIEFSKNNIEIPFPQRVITIKKES